MKCLIIGIDGADQRIFSGLKMEFLERVLQDGSSIPLTEDLWSRGWAEMLTGLHGLDTGAFYEFPKLDGSHDFTQSFGLKNLDENPKVTALWDLLDSAGVSQGYANVPTTMPAPKVDGFFIAGAGGGLGNLGSTLPRDAYHPESAGMVLEETNYVLDLRFMASGIKDEDTLFDSLEQMVSRRTEAFLKLGRATPVDFGFIAYMATSRMQNIGMSEIEAILAQSDMEELNTSGGGRYNSFQQRLLKLYQLQDQCVGRLLDELAPEHLIIVGDHGAAPYLYRANANAFLERAGYQSRAAARRTVRSIARTWAPQWLKRYMFKKLPKVTKRIARGFDPKRSLAFGSKYVPGVFVNDERRFGGPVKEEDAADLTGRICEDFNQTDEAKEFEMKARPYRQEHLDRPFADFLPDVWIDRADEIFFDSREGFVEKNLSYGPIKDLNDIGRDMYTGVKRRHPLCLVDSKTAQLIRDGDTMDLRLVYRLVERIFGIA